MAGDIFPWFWNPSITYQSQMDLGQFTHTFYCQIVVALVMVIRTRTFSNQTQGKGPDDNPMGFSTGQRRI
ncbi:MAG: hypothetical protein CM15mV41_0180 [Caudoviricetes sp.]|nr:MAG: hypothetical protein CM15mV41_0180 [Caudoviricetes sp.]